MLWAPRRGFWCERATRPLVNISRVRGSKARFTDYLTLFHQGIFPEGFSALADG